MTMTMKTASKFIKSIQTDRAARRKRKLCVQIRDAVYELKYRTDLSAGKTSLLVERIHRMIREAEEVGIDVLYVLPYGYEYMAVDAMPHVFEIDLSYYTYSDKVVRKEDEDLA